MEKYFLNTQLMELSSKLIAENLSSTPCERFVVGMRASDRTLGKSQYFRVVVLLVVVVVGSSSQL